MSTKNLPKTLSSETIYEDRYLKVKKDLLLNPGEKQKEYVFIQKPDTAIIIAKKDDLFYLIREFRYPSKRFFTQFPLESKEKNESFIECAKRGLIEEVGLESDDWQLLGSFFVDPGISNQICQVYLAKNIRKTQFEHRNEGEYLKVIPLRSNDIYELINSGEAEGWTIASWAMYKSRVTKI